MIDLSQFFIKGNSLFLDQIKQFLIYQKSKTYSLANVIYQLELERLVQQ
jgi:hypothetical protein